VGGWLVFWCVSGWFWVVLDGLGHSADGKSRLLHLPLPFFPTQLLLAMAQSVNQWWSFI